MALTPAQPLRVLISYSHADEDLRRRLVTHLAALEQRNLISIWHDRKILPGQEWDHQICKELDEADIILFLVSPDFIYSKYIRATELARALQRRGVTVVPIILRPCQWQLTVLQAFQALPGDNKVIGSNDPHLADEAFLEVANGLHSLIIKMNERRSKDIPDNAPLPGRESQELSSPIRVFVGHLAEDREVFDQMRAEFHQLSSDGLLAISDEDTELEFADVIVLVISGGILNGNLIHRAADRYHRVHATIVPVLYRSCPWKSIPLFYRQNRPVNDVPICDFPNAQLRARKLSEAVQKIRAQIAI